MLLFHVHCIYYQKPTITERELYLLDTKILVTWSIYDH